MCKYFIARVCFCAGLLTLVAACVEQGTVSKAGVSVERFHQPGIGSVNTWIVEGEESVLVVDAQRTLSAGELVADRLKQIGKPLAGILITHPHPDHTGGLPSILAEFPNTPVIGTQGVADEIVSDSLGMFGFARRVNGDEYPTRVPEITQIIAGEEILTFGDIEIVVDDIGPSESIAMTLFHMPSNDLVFIGDMADNNMYGFVLEKRTKLWLEQIESVLSIYGDRSLAAYPGHGDVAGLETLLEQQAVWLNDMRELTLAKLDDQELSDDEVERVIAEFEQRHPNQLPVAPIPQMRALSVRAVAEELLAD